MIYLRVGRGNGMERKKSKRMGLERDWDCDFSRIPFGSYTNFIKVYKSMTYMKTCKTKSSRKTPDEAVRPRVADVFASPWTAASVLKVFLQVLA
jgi:hypothetical protein